MILSDYLFALLIQKIGDYQKTLAVAIPFLQPFFSIIFQVRQLFHPQLQCVFWHPIH